MSSEALRRIYYSKLGAPVHTARRLASAVRLLVGQRRGSVPDLLHIGAGPHRRSGWINGDITFRSEYYIDATKPLPFASGTLRFIYAEHFIEHLDLDEGRRFLADCARVLRPGGVLRLTTPDLHKLAALYLDLPVAVRRQEVLARHARHMNLAAAEVDWCRYLNDKLRLGGSHRFIYDREALGRELAVVGFTAVEVGRHGESSHAELANLERHFEAPWLDEAEQIILEATR